MEKKYCTKDMDRPFFKPAEPWNGGTVNGTLEFDFNITKF